MITIPSATIIGFCVSFVALWYIKQLDPIYTGACRLCFAYIEIEVTNERTKWCKENITNFWFEFNGVYYFRRKVDATGFKLAWI